MKTPPSWFLFLFHLLRRKVNSSWFMGFTNWGNLYTNYEFEITLTKNSLVIFNSLTILMVFFSGHGSELLTDKDKRIYFIVAGVAAVVHASSSLADGWIRVKVPRNRIFAELSLAAGITTIGSSVLVLAHDFWAYFLAGFVFALAMTIICLFIKPKAEMQKSNPLIHKIIDQVSKDSNGNNVLCLAALIYVALKADQVDIDELIASMVPIEVKVDETAPVDRSQKPELDEISKKTPPKNTKKQPLYMKSSTKVLSMAKIWEASHGLSSTGVEARDGYVVRGFVNPGNTCFFNAIMQSLMSLDPLRNFFMKEDVCEGPLACSLQKLFTETKAGLRSTSIDPTEFYRLFCDNAPQFKGFQQQDSHELLRYLLDSLHTEESALRKMRGVSDITSTLVDSVFAGETSRTLSCMVCEHVSVEYEPFMDLSVAISFKKTPKKMQQTVSPGKKFKASQKEDPESVPMDTDNVVTGLGNKEVSESVKQSEALEASGSDPEDSDSVSIERCLDHYTELEVFPDEDAWNCPECLQLDNETAVSAATRRDTTSRTLINKTPEVLVIHLKRFLKDVSGRVRKLDAHVDFKEDINLTQWMDKKSKEDMVTYRLTTLVEHFGNMTNGHYVSYVRGGGQGVWYSINDTFVHQVRLDDVLSSQAYILFYERIIAQD
ncbi:unnamed protein product [Arabis nemorensis]|uniref:USP domain-containing protein n=1 Tax=Arabis nemorensis TaxID=586526 RepID=A0A565AN96_9BRAS|nr:unnamed protein product [Arabis nemorensis]